MFGGEDGCWCEGLACSSGTMNCMSFAQLLPVLPIDQKPSPGLFAVAFSLGSVKICT